MRNFILNALILAASATWLRCEDAIPNVCPRCQAALISVPVLIGFPSREYTARENRGEALLGGCVGNPAKPESAVVCLKCRKWRTLQMQIWQPLPKNFGSEKASPKPPSNSVTRHIQAAESSFRARLLSQR